MNTLRKLEAGWQSAASDEAGFARKMFEARHDPVRHDVIALTYSSRAKELSSAIPAWERLEKSVARTVERMSGPVGVDATDLHELRAALEGVKAK